MLVSELSQIIKKDYDWVFELNLKKKVPTHISGMYHKKNWNLV